MCRHRPMSSWLAAAVAVLALPLVATLTVQAKERRRPDVAPLIALAEAGSTAQAAAGFGKLYQKAVKGRDLVDQQVVMDGLRLALSSGDGNAAAGVEHREALEALLGELGPDDTTGLLSTHYVALEALLVATRAAQVDGIQMAAQVVLRHEKAKGAGAACKAHAAYARGMQALAAGTTSDASTHLARAFEMCRTNGWRWVGFHAGVEWALLHASHTTGGAETTSALRQVGSWFAEPAQSELWSFTHPWLQNRLAKLPAELMAAWREATSACPGQGAPGVGGGSADNQPEPGAISPVGKALRRARSSLVLAEITRRDDGYDVTLPFLEEPSWKEPHPADAAARVGGRGGLMFAFGSSGVRLLHVDPVGNRGEPQDIPGPRPFLMLQDLAPGETWTLKADGSVTIK